MLRILSVYDEIYERAKQADAPAFSVLLEALTAEGKVTALTNMVALTRYAVLGFAEAGHDEHADALMPEGVSQIVLSCAARGYAKRADHGKVTDLIKRGASVGYAVQGYGSSEIDCQDQIDSLLSHASDNSHLIFGWAEHGNRDDKLVMLYLEGREPNSTHALAEQNKIKKFIIRAYASQGNMEKVNFWKDFGEAYEPQSMDQEIGRGLAQGGYDEMLQLYLQETDYIEHVLYGASFGCESVGRVSNISGVYNYGLASAGEGLIEVAYDYLSRDLTTVTRLLAGFAGSGYHQQLEKLWHGVSSISAVVSSFTASGLLRDESYLLYLLAQYQQADIREQLANAISEKFPAYNMEPLLQQAEKISYFMTCYAFSYNQAHAMSDVDFLAYYNNVDIDNASAFEVLCERAYDEFGIKRQGGMRDFVEKIKLYQTLKLPIIQDLNDFDGKQSDDLIKKINTFLTECKAATSQPELIQVLKKSLSAGSAASIVEEVAESHLRKMGIVNKLRTVGMWQVAEGKRGGSKEQMQEYVETTFFPL